MYISDAIMVIFGVKFLLAESYYEIFKRIREKKYQWCN
jgi:hypothetical protein